LSIYYNGEFFNTFITFSNVYVYNVQRNNQDCFLLADDGGVSGTQDDCKRVRQFPIT
jgi:hypothetical protein